MCFSAFLIVVTYRTQDDKTQPHSLVALKIDKWFNTNVLLSALS